MVRTPRPTLYNLRLEEVRKWLQKGERCPPEALASVKARFEEEKAAAERAPIVFRHRATRDRLTIARDGDAWVAEWAGNQRRLERWLGWTAFETSDGTKWIIGVPYSGTDGNSNTPYPRRPHPSLVRATGRELGRWTNALSAYASPELAPERATAITVGQVMRALAEALRRGDSDGEKLLKEMEDVARPYLGKLYIRGHDKPAEWSPQEGKHADWRLDKGLKLAPDRPTVVEELARYWRRYLPPDERTGEAAEAVAADFIRRVREGVFYAELANDLPDLLTAGATQVREIARLYRKACIKVRDQRHELLCSKCAGFCPEEATRLGKDGGRYSNPEPGDAEEWGCLGRNAFGNVCEPRSAWELDQYVHKQALGLVRKSASALGHPRPDSLTDFLRVAQERIDGDRA